MKLGELIAKNAIVADLSAIDRKAALKELVTRLREAYGADTVKVNEVVEALLKREKLGSTGMGNGVAVPHAKLEGLKGIVGVFGRSAKGIDFNAVDGEAVHLMFLILSPFEQADLHIQALQRISQAVRQQNFCKFLLAAKGVKEIVELFNEVDEAIKV
ncbi:MAG: PTS sugar transporter subunit IIA [Planctomycetes bacterium]|nr:PTS sugar transporter subunit IIA [Planctomycetota bacterium]